MKSSQRTLLALVVCSLAACQRSPHEPASSPQPSPPSTNAPSSISPHQAPGANAPAGELAWDSPSGWQRVTPSTPMRRAQYRIPNAGGEPGDAELTVITFGPGQGGNVDANLQRWFGQVTQADGRPASETASRRTMTVNGMNVTIGEAAGRLGGGPAMPGMPQAASFEHGRLLGAIVETANGPWFFKMTGPDQTVASARGAFEGMLRSLRTQ